MHIEIAAFKEYESAWDVQKDQFDAYPSHALS